MKSLDVENIIIGSQCVQNFAHIMPIYTMANGRLLYEQNPSIQPKLINFGQNIQLLAMDNISVLRVSPKTHFW
jgi:hypothetical protein